jgi:hypothetical protein
VAEEVLKLPSSREELVQLCKAIGNTRDPLHDYGGALECAEAIRLGLSQEEATRNLRETGMVTGKLEEPAPVHRKI